MLMIGFFLFESRGEKHGVMFFFQKTQKIGKKLMLCMSKAHH
jgi:hypothetical protein